MCNQVQHLAISNKWLNQIWNEICGVSDKAIMNWSKIIWNICTLVDGGVKYALSSHNEHLVTIETIEILTKI